MSNKIRVYELAKKLELESNDLIEILQDLDIDVTSHMCSITEKEAETVMELILGDDDKEEKKEENQKAIVVKANMTLGDFAEILDKQPNTLIMELMNEGIMATINQNIDFDTMEILADKHGVNIKKEKKKENDLYELENFEDDPSDLEPRPPVVTVMGHVDHGKTSLLDAIRETDVTKGEAGGITQHIGASEIKIEDGRMVFLDTPGHQSFTTLRARGAQITDIAILVVAADDGVMPQTIEAIDHAKAAGVPIIVAINKIDVPGANPQKVIQELSEHGVLVEDWGGDVISCKVSALKKEGIKELLEMVLLTAEMEELKANPNRPGIGTIIEANLEKGRGPVASILVDKGTMRVGDFITVGKACGRIRAMYGHHGKKIKKALPATPVKITGLSEVPNAGEKIYVTESDQRAKELAESNRIKLRKEKLQKSKHVSLNDLFDKIQEGELKKLNIIIKADAHGSVEALKGSLLNIDSDEIKINIIHANIGSISEADVSLAAASNAIILGFNVRPPANVMKVANAENVELRTYRIIYNAIEDIRNAMIGMLEPDFVEVVLGKVEVRNLFKASGIGTIAGCYVKDGKIRRNSKVRLLRDDIVVYEGELSSLKRFENDAKEVATGYECGITLENFNDIKVGDIIEPYYMKEVKKSEL